MTLVLCDVDPVVRNVLDAYGLTDKIGAANIFDDHPTTWLAALRQRAVRPRTAAPSTRRVADAVLPDAAATERAGEAAASTHARRVPPAATPAGPGRRSPGPDRAARGAGGDADPRARARPLRPDGRLAVHVLPRRGAADGRRPRAGADERHHRPAVRRRAPRRTSGCSPRPSATCVFDINDFDETLPGPFEWDLKRLAASLVVAGRGRAASTDARGRHAVHRAIALVPRRGWPSYAAMRAIDVYYARVDVAGDPRVSSTSGPGPMIEATVKSARPPRRAPRAAEAHRRRRRQAPDRGPPADRSSTGPT